MPLLNGQISPHLGPTCDLYISVSEARLHALQQGAHAVPQPVRVRALIDTGASHTCADEEVIELLGLTPTGVVPVITPSTGETPHLCLEYDVGLLFTLPDVHVARGSLPVVAVPLRSQGIELLIGRDVLEHSTFFYNGPAAQFSWAL